MGAYDILDAEFASVKGGMTEHEAFYAILASAVMADGRLDRREEEELSALSHRSVALSELYQKSPDKFASMAQNVMVKLRAPGDAVAKALDVSAEAALQIARNPDMAFSAYAHAVDIIFADAAVNDIERRFLKHLAEKLSLNPSEAVEVLRMLNRKNKF